MIEQKTRREFWGYLTTEKNQPRPKGLTVQRLAVIKPLALASDLWMDVIERHGAAGRTAQEFYASMEAAAMQSRAAFWEAVRGIIRSEETAAQQTAEKRTDATSRRGQGAATVTSAGAGRGNAGLRRGRNSTAARNDRNARITRQTPNSRKRF